MDFDFTEAGCLDLENFEKLVNDDVRGYQLNDTQTRAPIGTWKLCKTNHPTKQPTHQPGHHREIKLIRKKGF